MAKKKTKATTAIANWDEELAAAAKVAAGIEANTGSGGKFFSTKGGILAYDGKAMPGNQMAVVVLDFVMENVHYDGKYTGGDDRSAPDCYAFGTTETDMQPHSAVKSPKSENCRDCALNQFGSADTGKGKACKNRRRLALIPAGNFSASGRFEPFTKAEDFEEAQIAFLGLPATSIKAWAAIVKQLEATVHRPPYGVFMKLKVVPDPKSQFRFQFDVLEQVPNSLGAVIKARHLEAKNSLVFPYATAAEAPAKKAPAKKRKY